MQNLFLELTPREAALVFLIRRIRFGQFESVTIHDGQPLSLMAGPQRIDLSKKPDLELALQAGGHVLFDRSKGDLPSSIPETQKGT